MNSYNESLEDNLDKTLDEMKKKLPEFCSQYFTGIDQYNSIRTKVGYGYNLLLFFRFLTLQNPVLARKGIRQISVDDLAELRASDIEEYLVWLKRYKDEDGKTKTNSPAGQAAKLAAVRSLFKYLLRTDAIKKNPAALIPSPKVRDKEIVALDPAEVAELLDTVENWNGTTGHQKAYLDHARVRDTAIMTLLLGTGIRVSELVGIDLKDINLESGELRITRKGGKKAIIYPGDETLEALGRYIAVRQKEAPADKDETALFLSNRRKRIAVRTVETLVGKYAKLVTLKDVTPHCFRRTYATELYRASSDIYLTASALGHKDPSMAAKHYASMDEEKKRKARNLVPLREKLNGQ